MVLKELMDKIRGMGQSDEEEEMPDDMTKDKYLRSLRRERRIQMEEVEKEQLKKKISDFKRERMRKHLFGIKEKVYEKKLNLKKKEILSEGHNILGKKTKKPGQQGFFNKYKL